MTNWHIGNIVVVSSLAPFLGVPEWLVLAWLVLFGAFVAKW